MEELSFCALKRKKRQNSILSHITSLTEKHKIILVLVLKDSCSVVVPCSATWDAFPH